MEKEIFELTEEGKAELEKELREKIDVDRKRITEALQNARAMGDLSENADYSAARDEQAKNEARIKELENILNNSKIVNSNSKKGKEVVKISNTVSYEEVESKEIWNVKIVSTVEVDINDESVLKISNVSVLGEALLGKKVGDIVTVKVAKPYDIVIKSIK